MTPVLQANFASSDTFSLNSPSVIADIPSVMLRRPYQLVQFPIGKTAGNNNQLFITVQVAAASLLPLNYTTRCGTPTAHYTAMCSCSHKF